MDVSTCIGPLLWSPRESEAASSLVTSTEVIDASVSHHWGLEGRFAAARWGDKGEDDLSLGKWVALGTALSRVWEARSHALLMGHITSHFISTAWVKQSLQATIIRWGGCLSRTNPLWFVRVTCPRCKLPV